MPEALTDDEMRDAFTRWRADELTHVAGPGTDVIHRTVRRRRATTVGVVAATVLAVAGGVAVGLGAGVGQPAPPPAPAAPAPVSTGPDLVKLGEQASQALDAIVPGDFAAGGGSGPLEGAYTNEDVATMPAGQYRLVAVCVGAGKTRFEVVQNGHAEGLDVVCDGTTGSLEFRNQPGLSLYVNIEPDAPADGHAGFAYRIEAR